MKRKAGLPRRLSVRLGQSSVLLLCVFAVYQAAYAGMLWRGDCQSAQLHSKTQVPQTVTHIFSTLWADELRLLLNLTNAGPFPPESSPYDIGELVRRVQLQGVNLIFTSFKWSDQEPTPGAYDFRLQNYVQQVVCGQGLKLIVLYDAHSTPAWVIERHPEAVLVDGTDHPRKDISFSHSDAMQLVHDWHDAAMSQLAAGDSACIHSIQPSFNNEYETKYTQEYDSFQDYSPSAMELFRVYMRSVHGSVQHWNQRWGSQFENWDMVKPAHFYQSRDHFNNTADSLLYWDFQHFRHLQIHAAHETCCMRVASHGFRCILHFGEFLSSNDAIYAGGVVFSLSASPWVDYVVVDSNFQTSAGLLNDVRVVQVLISAMKPFRKPAFFEGAFERFSNKSVHQRAVDLTVASGAHGVGFTNWLGRTGPTFFEDILRGHRAQDLQPLASPVLVTAPHVAIVSPYRSYWAFKGVPALANGSLATTDPQQDRLFECLDVIERAVPSLQQLQVFAVPAMLGPVLHNFEQVWYVEPEYLLSGDAKTIAALKHQAAVLGIAFNNCRANPAAPVVVPECCPGV